MIMRLGGLIYRVRTMVRLVGLGILAWGERRKKGGPTRGGRRSGGS